MLMYGKLVTIGNLHAIRKSHGYYTILIEQTKNGLSKTEVERKIKSVLLRSEMSSKPFTTADSDEGYAKFQVF